MNKRWVLCLALASAGVASTRVSRAEPTYFPAHCTEENVRKIALWSRDYAAKGGQDDTSGAAKAPPPALRIKNVREPQHVLPNWTGLIQYEVNRYQTPPEWDGATLRMDDENHAGTHINWMSVVNPGYLEIRARPPIHKGSDASYYENGANKERGKGNGPRKIILRGTERGPTEIRVCGFLDQPTLPAPANMTLFTEVSSRKSADGSFTDSIGGANARNLQVLYRYVAPPNAPGARVQSRYESSARDMERFWQRSSKRVLPPTVFVVFAKFPKSEWEAFSFISSYPTGHQKQIDELIRQEERNRVNRQSADD